MDLFGNEDALKAPRRAKASDADIKMMFSEFHDGFFNKFGFKPRFRPGKDAAHFRDLKRDWEMDGALALIRFYFVTTDPRAVRSDYTVGALASLDQHLMLVMRNARPTDARTIEAMDLLARATTPRNERR